MLENNPNLQFHERIVDLIDQISPRTSKDSFYRLVMIAYATKTLNALLLCFENEVLNRDKAIQLLHDYWHRTKHTSCGYTAYPDLELTTLLCDIAEHLATPDQSAIELLMPGLTTESELFPDTLADLKTLPLKEIINTHIVGDGGNYLIPVSHLIAYEQTRYGTGEIKDGLYNPYYDYQMHEPEHCWLSSNEIKRLIYHSPASRTLDEATNTLLEREQSNPNLLSALRELCRALHLNDAHGGIGEQEDAGDGTYIALAKFNDFFKRLSTDKKRSIPDEVSKEIHLLLHYASNQNYNTQIGSCIGTRGEKLTQAIKKCEQVLENITIEQAQKNNLKEEALSACNHAQTHLHQLIHDKKYTGRDGLGLGSDLLAWLDVLPTISSYNDLLLLMNSSTQDISFLIKTYPWLAIQINKQLANLDVLVSFLLESYQHEKLEIIIKLLLTKKNKLFCCSHQISLLLPMLNLQQTKLIVSLIMNHSPRIVTNASSFAQLLKHLPEEQKIELGDLFKDRLLGSISSIDDFSNSLQCLSPKQCANLCHKLYMYAIPLLNSGERVHRLFAQLNLQQSEVVCQYLHQSLALLVERRGYFVSQTHYVMGNELIRSLGTDKEKLIYQYWFKSLVASLKANSTPSDNPLVIETLFKSVTQAAEHYFNNEYTPAGYDKMKQTCLEAVEIARPQLRDKNDFIKKLILGIATLGLAPTILSLYSKVMYGTFNFSFFASKEEEASDTIMNKLLHNNPVGR